MSDVFISYSRKDNQFARKLTDTLESRGRDVWIDWQDIPRAEDWLQEIRAGIEAADTFVFIVSQHSLISEICNIELLHARANEKRIIPLILEVIADDVELRVKGAWFDQEWASMAQENWAALGHRNWLFFDNADNFDSEFTELLHIMDVDQSHLKIHTRLLVRAREWEIAEHNPSFLLTGEEIDSAEAWLESATKQGKTPEPSDLHRSYISTSRTVADEEEQERETLVKARLESEEQAQRAHKERQLVEEQVQAAQKASKRSSRVAVIAGIATLIALVVGLITAQQAIEARSQVFQAGETLTPIPQTLTSVADDAQIAIGERNQAETQVMNANETLSPIPPTLTQAANDAQIAIAERDQAETEVAQVGETLTPIPSTLTQVADEALNAINAKNIAETQVVKANETLAPIPPTLTQAANSINVAVAQVATANQNIIQINETSTSVFSTQSANVAEALHEVADAQMLAGLAATDLAFASDQLITATQALVTATQIAKLEAEAQSTLIAVNTEVAEALVTATQAAVEREITNSLTNALLQLSDDPSAQLLKMNNLVEQFPDQALGYIARGLIYYSQDDAVAAIADFDRAIELDPQYAGVAYSSRGNVLLDQGDLEAAIIDYSRAILLNDEDVDAYNGRGNAYKESSEYELALNDFARAIELEPSLALLYGNRGNVYIEMEDNIRALADYNRAIELDPDSTASYSNRSNLYLQIGNIDNALADQIEHWKLILKI